MEANDLSAYRVEFTETMSKLVFKTLQTISKRGEPLTSEMLAELLGQDQEYGQALEKVTMDQVMADGLDLADREDLTAQLEALSLERDVALEEAGKYKKEILRQGAEDMDDTSEARICPRRFRFLLVSFLNIVRMDLEPESLEHVDELIGEAQSCETSEDLSRVADRILDLVESRLEHVHTERQKNVDFLKAVDQNLLAIEGHVMDTNEDAQQSQDDNKAFYEDMTGRVQDMRQTLVGETPVPDLRGVLLEKMQLIKAALDDKHARDVKQLNKANARLAKLKNRLKVLIRQVSEARSKAKTLEKQAMVDPLTEIPNRRAYENKLQEEWARFTRYGAAFSMLMVDLDHFKSINDDFGHAVGDKCLQGVVGLMRPSLRATDFLARFGGEEFVVILPDTDQGGAEKVGEKLRRKVEKAKFLYDGDKVGVTISIGGTQVTSQDESPAQVFERLDAAMYEAKNGGRNQLVWRNR